MQQRSLLRRRRLSPGAVSSLPAVWTRVCAALRRVMRSSRWQTRCGGWVMPRTAVTRRSREASRDSEATDKA